jgi:hypothetical protein
MVMKMKQDLPGMGDSSFSVTTDVDMTAVSRKGSQTTVQSKVKSVKVTVPPKGPMSAMKESMEKSLKGMTTSATMSSDFKVIGGSAAGGPAAMQGMNGMSGMPSLNVPAHPLRVGETWSSVMDMGKLMGSGTRGMRMTGKLPLKFRLKVVRGSGASAVAVVEMSMAGTTTMTSGANKVNTHLNTKGTVSIDVATGMTREVASTSDTTTDFGGRKFTQHISQTMRLH